MTNINRSIQNELQCIKTEFNQRLNLMEHSMIMNYENNNNNNNSSSSNDNNNNLNDNIDNLNEEDNNNNNNNNEIVSARTQRSIIDFTGRIQI